MTVTEAYSQAHEAFVTVGRAHGLHPFGMRVLVALEEREGEGRTDQLEVALQAEGSAVRRSYGVLWDRELLKADAGDGTYRPKRGTRTRLTLTDAGRFLARQALARAAEGLTVAA